MTCNSCGNNTLPDAPCPQSNPYPPIKFCTMGGSYMWDGTGLKKVSSIEIADGEYSKITIQDGCVVGLGECEKPSYMAPACAELPSECPDATDTPVSGEAGNLTVDTAGGLLTKLYITDTPTVTHTGSGTSDDPLKLTTTGVGGEQPVVTGVGGVEVVPVAGGYQASLANVGTAGTYGGFTVDTYGRFVGYTAPDSGPIVDVISGMPDEVSVSKTSGIVTVSLATGGPVGSKDLGTASMEITPGGRVKTITPVLPFASTQTFNVTDSLGQPRVLTFSRAGVLVGVA